MTTIENDPELRASFAATREANEARRLAENASRAKLQESIAESSRLRDEQSKLDQRARFEADLQESFFLANPTATGADWERLKQTIIDDHMRQAATAQPVGTFARIRAGAR